GHAPFLCASPLFGQEFAGAYEAVGTGCSKRHGGSVMAPGARHSTSKTTHDARDADVHDAHGEFWPGERIGPPLRRTGGKAMLRGVIILIALGGCWTLLGDQTTWPSWQSIETAVSSWMNRSAPGTIEPAALAMATSPAARA